jgi:dolichol-phosphate hexosyltransferase
MQGAPPKGRSRFTHYGSRFTHHVSSKEQPVYKGCKISLVVPCYNEEAGLPYVMQDLPAIIDEVVVVDNNSKDCTAEVARSYGATVVFEPRQGYGAAYKAGFRRATGDFIVTMDGDGTYPSGFVKVVLDVMLAENLDFVTCDRTGHKTAGSGTLTRVFGNWLLGVVQNVLFFTSVHDSQSGMWVFRRDILPLLNLSSDGMALSEEIKVEAFTHPDITSCELPIYYRPRLGESKLNVWKDGLRNLQFLFHKRWELWRARRPRAERAVRGAGFPACQPLQTPKEE